MEQRLVEIVGIVNNIVFSNEDTGFTVLNIEYNDDYLCVVGDLFGVNAGEELKLTGYFSSHPTYGDQFKAVMFQRQLPSTAVAIYKYLSSGVIKGIGPSIAKKIVDKFGDDTLTILEEEPQQLLTVSGISQKKADAFIKEFEEIFSVKTLMLFLSNLGITPIQSINIYKKWGRIAKDIIITNPYILCTNDLGITFSTADKIAMKHNIVKDNDSRILAGIIYILNHNNLNGHTCLPYSKVLSASTMLLELDEDTVSKQIESFIENKSLYKLKGEKDFIFTPTYYLADEYISGRIIGMVNTANSEINCDDNELDEIIKSIEAEKGIVYDIKQKHAIKGAYKNSIFILTGGPGTGKTTTLNGIISLLEYQGKKVAVAAPTGRAAKRASELTRKDAKTLHRLLEVGFTNDNKQIFSRHENNPLEYDAIIIDEISMVDTLLFEALLKATKNSTKLILVGDFNQLPSVGAGNVLQDLRYSDIIPTVELKQIFRQAAQSLIVTNSHKIIAGEAPDLNIKDNDFFFISSQNSANISSTVSDLYCTRLPSTYNYNPMEQIQVLCPSRKGDIGTIELNRNLQSRLNPKSTEKYEFTSYTYTFREGDKVMQIKNNYGITWKKGEEEGSGIFNGDIGIIKMIDLGSKTLLIDFDSKQCFYSFEMANELELAYAITIHKSQGSEFDAIIIPIFGGFDKLYYRNLLYTAVTRAKKMLIIIGSKNRLMYMINNNHRTLRYTGLRLMLK